MSISIKPIELQNAIAASDLAWKKYDDAVEAGADKEIRQQLWNVVNWMEQRQGDMYKAWQKLGGTSDIESLHPVDEAYRMEHDGCGNDDLYDYARGG